ncbi:histidine phosphatase family protein [Allobranchiibius sp. GilTou38]|uniref:histidine phosphatase family protein n=1 Tax=Allobranchiibius sp. GilTou38 TaxID=2815210 RepID=UPI001AA1D1E8|nr:histidine phosphatase family protein [Allobranchiibius sp. GilTou38]MBO1766476.1 MSMEG_4193 family putative phosphomutase [Allobranchiibius sp. GilTou38]
MATLLLLRHGRSSANTAGVLAGWTPDVHLDDTGREQVKRLSEQLADLPLARIVSSPLERCQETAAAVAAPHAGLQVETDEDLGECKYGAWTGRKISELAKEPLWRTVQDHPAGAVFPPSEDFESESLAGMHARAVAAVRRLDAEIEAQHGNQAVWCAVSHGDVIKAILADALGLHLDQFQRIMTGPASLSVVRYTPNRPFVVRVNDQARDVADLMPTKQESSGDATPGGSTGVAEESDQDTATTGSDSVGEAAGHDTVATGSTGSSAVDVAD